MILSGRKIFEEVQKGNIQISDFDLMRLNPNSYNLRLHDELLVYDRTRQLLPGEQFRPSLLQPLDMKESNPYRIVKIPEDGLILFPGILYLGRTMERTRTDCFVPMLEGRSSVGRLGIYIHVTAGFGDVGFDGFWTLEISCIQPVKIYPGVYICQIYYHTIKGEYEKYGHGRSGKYQNNTGIQPSMMWKDFKEAEKGHG